jgi:hypothetical protein
MKSNMQYFLIWWLIFTMASLSILVLCIVHKKTAERMGIDTWGDIITFFVISILPFINVVPVFKFLDINLDRKLHE